MGVAERRVRAVVGIGAAAVLAAGAVGHPNHEGSIGEGDPGTSLGGSFPAQNIELRGQVTLAELGPGSRTGADCWGYVSPSGREYGILGVSDGFAFIEVTDALRPEVVAFIPGASSVWRDVKTFGSYAYGVSEADIGLQVFDLSQIDAGVVTLANTITLGGELSTHNVAINEESGYLYRLAGGSADIGLRVYDLNASPTAPPLAGEFSPYYVHDAQIVSYDSGPYAGREIAFCCAGTQGGFGATSLRIVDVTDKSNMFEIGVGFYPNAVYSHQGWLSADRQYFYLNDELDEQEGAVSETTTRVFDVSDLANPVFLGTFSSGVAAIDHNLYVADGKIWQANYRSGLRVFDASADPVSPPEVAWFDTFPADDAAAFDGAWSVYPFFPSGNVIVSDIQQGLLVLRPAIERVMVMFHKGIPDELDPAGCTKVHAHVMNMGLTHDPTQLRLFVETSAGVEEVLPVAVESSGPGHYDFFLPELPCGETAEFWVEAPTVEGPVFTGPSRAPVERIARPVRTGSAVVFEDTFESDLGWTVSGDAAAGVWERGVPAGGNRGDPPTAAGGSGSAFVTGNLAGNTDVDDGSTVLTSPLIDLSAGGEVTFEWWYNSVSGGTPGSEDGLFVEVSDDGGGSWSRVRSYTTLGTAWRSGVVRFGPSGDAGASSSARVRFVASDLSPGHVVEAGIDSVVAREVSCDPPAPAGCPGDLDGDGGTGVSDFFLLAGAFGDAAPRCSAVDLDGSGTIDVGDFFTLAGDFGCTGG